MFDSTDPRYKPKTTKCTLIPRGSKFLISKDLETSINMPANGMLEKGYDGKVHANFTFELPLSGHTAFTIFFEIKCGHITKMDYSVYGKFIF